MTDGNKTTVLSEEQLSDEYYDVLISAHREMREAFLASGMTQEELAARLDVDKSLISRRLTGDVNLTLKTLSHMGTGMGYRVHVTYTPFNSLGSQNWRPAIFAVDGGGRNPTPESSKQLTLPNPNA